MSEPASWRNRSPGDLSVELDEVTVGNVGAAVVRSREAFVSWSRWEIGERRHALEQCRERLKEKQEELARLIALEVGKPLREARLEMAAVVAKFDLTFADAERYLVEEQVTDGPHPAVIRRRAYGPAAVVAPFNFPIHLGHGAAVAYLLAGNPVIFKPSPLAANVGAAYAREMQAALPEGVFELVQGGGEIGQELCLHPAVRSVCFTGSVPVGTALARALAADYSKNLALELGGKNSVLIFRDARLDLAAEAVADGMCLTTGQRCNATSRILVQADVAEEFSREMLRALGRFQPGDPLNEKTMLGPLVSAKAVERYRRLIGSGDDWIAAGEVCGEVEGRKGYYVRPAVAKAPQWKVLGEYEEAFCPCATWEVFTDAEDALRKNNTVPYGLTASIFTESEEIFQNIGDRLNVGNLYANLPTTFSPSTLPFGGVGVSGNGKPGGRGFIRYTAEEQAVQWRKRE